MSARSNLGGSARNVGNIPTRIKCIICGQHKNHEHFSKNELKSISWKRNAKELRCQACNSGQQRLELECERCGKVKDNSKFSKASRRNGGNKWCIDCTIYKEAAAPHHIDDNLVADSWETEINDSMSAITIMPTLRSSVAESSITKEHRSEANTPTFGKTVTAPRAQATNEYVPPHLRQPQAISQASASSDNRSTTSSSNPYQSISGATESNAGGDGWKPVNTRRRPQVFNAFGPNGSYQQHTTSSAGGRTPLSYSTTESFSTAPAPPRSSSSVVTTSRRGGWAKPAGTKIPQYEAPEAAIPSPQKKSYNDDSDDYDEP